MVGCLNLIRDIDIIRRSLTAIPLHSPATEVHVLISRETSSHQLIQQLTTAFLLSLLRAILDQVCTLTNLFQANAAPFVEVEDFATSGYWLFSVNKLFVYYCYTCIA